MCVRAGNGTIDPLELRACLNALGALLQDTDVEEMFEVGMGGGRGRLQDTDVEEMFEVGVGGRLTGPA